jgi:hypothetical protein
MPYSQVSMSFTSKKEGLGFGHLKSLSIQICQERERKGRERDRKGRERENGQNGRM